MPNFWSNHVLVSAARQSSTIKLPMLLQQYSSENKHTKENAFDWDHFGFETNMNQKMTR